MLAPTPDRLEHARALIDHGAAQRRANQRRSAREPLREGLELALRCGGLRLARRATEELEATGARPRSVFVSGVDSLTASERRVARLAAEGMTNRQIAETLFVTPKTIETHLRHVYQKLEIANRSGLPAALEPTDSSDNRSKFRAAP